MTKHRRLDESSTLMRGFRRCFSRRPYPQSWRGLLEMFRPAFRRSRTFGLFVLLATGLVAQTTRRTVVGMLAGAGDGRGGVVSRGVPVLLPPRAGTSTGSGWSLARLIVDRLLAAGAPIDGGGRRHAVPPLGAEGASRVLDPRRLRAGPQRARPRQPVGDRRDRRPAAVLQRIRCACRCCCGCGAARAPPPRCSWQRELILASGPSVPGPAHARRRRRRLPRQAAAGRAHHDHHPAAGQRRPVRARPAAHRPTRPAPAQGAPAGHPGRDRRGRDLAARSPSPATAAPTPSRSPSSTAIWYGAFGNTEGRTVLVRDPGADRVLAIFTTDTDSDADDRRRTLRRPLADRDRHRRRQTTARHRPGPQPAAARGGAHRAVRVSASTASSSSGTRCTATTPTTSPAAAPTSPGTPTRPSPPSKTCSPSSAEPLSQHELPALPQLSPTPTNTATTNWPAPQPPRNCETQAMTQVSTNISSAAR